MMYSRGSGTTRHNPALHTARHQLGREEINPMGLNMMKKLEDPIQASTQQQSFLFSLQEEVRGLGCQMGDLKGTVDALQAKIEWWNSRKLPRQIQVKILMLPTEFQRIYQ